VYLGRAIRLRADPHSPFEYITFPRTPTPVDFQGSTPQRYTPVGGLPHWRATEQSTPVGPQPASAVFNKTLWRATDPRSIYKRIQINMSNDVSSTRLYLGNLARNGMLPSSLDPALCGRLISLTGLGSGFSVDITSC
jgi:hypothetical protein